MALINVAINFGCEYFCFVIYFSKIISSNFFPNFLHQNFCPKFFFQNFFLKFVFQKFLFNLKKNFFLRASLSLPLRLQRQNGLYVSVLWKIWYTEAVEMGLLSRVMSEALFFGSYCLHHTRREKFNFFPAPHNIRVLLYFFRNLRYSIEVLKCFSRWHLIAKYIKFWLEVDTSIFLYNHSDASVKFGDFAN